jgi:hypothetical protein
VVLRETLFVCRYKYLATFEGSARGQLACHRALLTRKRSSLMVGKISCFSAFRATPKKHARNGGALPEDRHPSGAAPGRSAGAAGPAAPPTFDAGTEIPGGLAGIRERMAAMGHFVMTPDAPPGAQQEEPQGPAGATGGTEPPSKRKKPSMVTQPETTGSPAGPGDFVLLADMCTEDGRSVEKPLTGAAAGERKHITQKVQSAAETAQAEGNNQYLHEIAYSLFPGREEVQRLHASHLDEAAAHTTDTSGASATHMDDLLFEADGEGQTEAERLLNAFATPGRAPAVVSRAKLDSELEKTPAAPAHVAAGASTSAPSHQRGNIAAASPSGANAGEIRAGAQQVQGSGQPAGTPLNVYVDEAKQSQRKTAISQLITTQGIRPSEIRGYTSTHTPRSPTDSISSGPSPARGPAWRDAAGGGGAGHFSNSPLSTARTASEMSVMPESPRDSQRASYDTRPASSGSAQVASRPTSAQGVSRPTSGNSAGAVSPFFQQNTSIRDVSTGANLAAMNTNIKSTAPLWAQLPPTSPQTPVTPQPPPEPSFRPQYPYCAAPTPAAEAVPELDTAAAAYDAQLHQSAAAAREVAEQQAAMVARQRQLMEIQQSKERQKLPQQQQQVEAQQQVGAQEQKARQQQKQQQKAHAPAAGDAGRDLMLDNIMGELWFSLFLVSLDLTVNM